jgi:hypothetical protein
MSESTARDWLELLFFLESASNAARSRLLVLPILAICFRVSIRVKSDPVGFEVVLFPEPSHR